MIVYTERAAVVLVISQAGRQMGWFDSDGHVEGTGVGDMVGIRYNTTIRSVLVYCSWVL